LANIIHDYNKCSLNNANVIKKTLHSISKVHMMY
jgi:hypothetical protein